MTHARSTMPPHAEAREPIDLTRIMLRPLASPLPLGFLTLAIGSFVLSGLQLTWIGVGQSTQVGMIILVAVAPVQALCSILGFLVRDVVMATGLGLIAGSWAAVGLLLATGTPGTTSGAMGLLAIGVAGTLLVPATAAAWSKPVATVLFTVAAARLACAGVYQLSGADAWQTLSGCIGLLLCAAGLYGSLALTLEDSHHHTVLPTNRRGTSRSALSGDLRDQVDDVATEAGVRQET